MTKRLQTVLSAAAILCVGVDIGWHSRPEPRIVRPIVKPVTYNMPMKVYEFVAQPDGSGKLVPLPGWADVAKQ